MGAGFVKPYRRWSIATRLTFLYSLSVFLILVVATVILYRDVVVTLEKRNSDYVRDEIGVVQGMMRGTNSERELRREIELEHGERKNVVHYIRVLDVDGRTLLENPGMERIIPADVFPPPTVGYIHSMTRLKWRAKDGSWYVLKAIRCDIAGFGGKARVLQIAMDITPLEASLAEYREKLAVMIILGVICSALAGIVVAKGGLLPLWRITRTAERISGQHLKERIEPGEWPRELTAMAQAFDSMLDRLDESFEGLSQYTANLAHELRTPINNLMVEADLALSRTRTPEEYQKVIGSNMEEYARLARMIDSLLFLARADKQQAGLDLAEIDVRRAVEDICEFYGAVATDEGKEISCRGEAELNADPVLFRRAVSNLVTNALKFTPEGGRIDISIRQGDDRSVEVAVSDTGCGIAAEHLPHVFDRFYRGEADSRHAPAGFGLGLAIVKSIMDLHHGAAEVRSQPAQGTTVTLKFPPPSHTPSS